MIKTQLNFSKPKFTFLVLAFSALLGIASYGYHIYSLFHDWQINMPQQQLEKLTRDLRVYQAKEGHFPNTFTEIDNLIWHTKPSLNYGSEGRQARTKNYYYFYTKIDNKTCAVWALPIGPQRHYASSYFLVLSPVWARRWIGKAMDDDIISSLPAIPTPDKLAELGMCELPGRTLSSR
ncbi:MAG: hypothetical protein J2P41_13870 [Blastocatellia bacterium]|nr:hypothetical protein [Blastocatellia bacterium]